MLPWLLPGEPFPATTEALDEPNGLLAAGGELTVERLVDAYRQGIFPWYDGDDGQPILWWSPAPRCVIEPDGLHLSRSLHKHLRSTPLRITLDHCFSDVMQRCAAPRAGQDGTWISAEMVDAYSALHQQGYAHSLEVWELEADQPVLAGAIYGLQLGQVFFGESMVSPRSNGSKVALAALAGLATTLDIRLIDCQVENPHLMRLGAQLWSRQRFEDALATAIPAQPLARPWPTLDCHWSALPDSLADNC